MGRLEKTYLGKIWVFDETTRRTSREDDKSTAIQCIIIITIMRADTCTFRINCHCFTSYRLSIFKTLARYPKTIRRYRPRAKYEMTNRPVLGYSAR